MVRVQDQIVGVFREERFSPGRIRDDAAILSHTARSLERMGLEVLLLRPEHVSKRVSPRMAFAMCESTRCLKTLEHWRRLGCAVFNRPEGVMNCRRWRIYSLLANGPTLLPKGMVIETSGGLEVNCDVGQGIWVKRWDTHATGSGAARLVFDHANLKETLAEFRDRRVKRVILIEHIDGDHLKFYGIRRSGWFRCYHPARSEMIRYPVLPEEIQTIGEQVAERLGLHIYGGDMVITEGKHYLVDMNSWPSFGAFRLEAAEQIAAFLAGHFVRLEPSNDVLNRSM